MTELFVRRLLMAPAVESSQFQMHIDSAQLHLLMGTTNIKISNKFSFSFIFSREIDLRSWWCDAGWLLFRCMQNVVLGVLHCSAIRSIEWLILVANFTTLRNTQRENNSNNNNSLFAVNTITINEPIKCITRSYVLTMPAHHLQSMNSWTNAHSLSFRDGISLQSIRCMESIKFRVDSHRWSWEKNPIKTTEQWIN